MNQTNICPCGSGEPSWWEHDANNIPLCRVCTKCRRKKLSRYRPEILTGYTQADVDEPIEPEDGTFFSSFPSTCSFSI